MVNETTLEAAKRLTSFKQREGYNFIAVYDYFATDGSYLHSVIRWKNPITGDKYIPRMRRNSDGTYELKGPTYDNGNPLYNLMELGQNPEARVYFVEGENKVEVLRGLGVLATTAGGSKTIGKADLMPLENRTIVIWPDNDDSGSEMTEDVIAGLEAIGCTVDVIDVEKLGLGPKGDVVDWLNLNPGATRDDVLALPIQKRPLTVPVSDGRFEVSRQGVFYVGMREGDDLPPKFVCSELAILGRARNENGGNWALVVEFSDTDTVKSLLMPLADLEGDGSEVRRRLADEGLRITSVSQDRHRLLQYLKEAPSAEKIRLVDRYGWHDGAYVSPGGQIGITNSTEKLLYQGSSRSSPQWSRRGTLEGCQKTILAKVAGNSRGILAVCVALAAPLIRLCGIESRVFHLRGCSSTGKSTILKISASLYGSHREIVRSWNSTANGLEGSLSACNDGVILLDELGQIDPKQARAVAYQLVNGTGKVRADRTGASIDPKRWMVLGLSTGELSLSQHSEAGGFGGLNVGEELRVLDIPADAGKEMGVFEELHDTHDPKGFVRGLLTDLEANYGHVGPEWIRLITTDPMIVPEIKEELPKRTHGLINGRSTNRQVFRVAETFSFLALVGELAIIKGLTGWEIGEAQYGIEKCFNDWFADFEGEVSNKEEENLVKSLKRFIITHGEFRFQLVGIVPTDRPVINRVGFYDKSRNEFLIPPETMISEVLKGFDSKWAVRVLIECGIIIRGNAKDRYTQKRRVDALQGNSLNFYVISGARLLSDGESNKDEPASLMTGEANG